MFRIILMIIATILLLGGALLMLTPMPGSTFMIAFGMMLLICTSRTAANYIKKLRIRFNSFNKSLTWLENKAGEKIGGVLKSTNPYIYEIPNEVLSDGSDVS